MSHEKSKASSEKHVGDEKRPTCFIAMPLTVPKDSSIYLKERHFQTVLHTIMVPAVEKVNFKAVLPQFDGSVVIPQEIVEQLTSCDMVLGDISASNPNVFFECGMRVALDKPAAFVKDSKTSIIPFDVRTIGVETYDPFVDFDMYPAEITKIANHLSSTFEKSKGHNLAWKNYNMHQREKLTLEALKEGDVNKLILERLDSMQNQVSNLTMNQERFVTKSSLNAVSTVGVVSEGGHKELYKEKHVRPFDETFYGIDLDVMFGKTARKIYDDIISLKPDIDKRKLYEQIVKQYSA